MTKKFKLRETELAPVELWVVSVFRYSPGVVHWSKRRSGTFLNYGSNLSSNFIKPAWSLSPKIDRSTMRLGQTKGGKA